MVRRKKGSPRREVRSGANTLQRIKQLQNSLAMERRSNFTLRSRLLLQELHTITQSRLTPAVQSMSTQTDRLLYIGRDRELSALLRFHFPFAYQYVSPDARAINGDLVPELVVYDQRYSIANQDARFDALLQRTNRPVVCFVIPQSDAGKTSKSNTFRHHGHAGARYFWVTPADHPQQLLENIIAAGPRSRITQAASKSLIDLVDKYEAAIIEAAMKICDRRPAIAARLLRISPTTLHGKLRRLPVARRTND